MFFFKFANQCFYHLCSYHLRCHTVQKDVFFFRPGRQKWRSKTTTDFFVPDRYRNLACSASVLKQIVIRFLRHSVIRSRFQHGHRVRPNRLHAGQRMSDSGTTFSVLWGLFMVCCDVQKFTWCNTRLSGVGESVRWFAHPAARDVFCELFGVLEQWNINFLFIVRFGN